MWIRLAELAVKFWLPKMMLHPRARSPVPLVKKPRGWAPFYCSTAGHRHTMPASNGSNSWTRLSWNVGLHMGPFVQSYIKDVGIRTTYRKK
jgi:hypothetical protein